MSDPKDVERSRREFSDRFNEALTAFKVPPKYRGRAKWVSARYGLSKTGARKWLEAKSMPEKERWEDIAAGLGVRVEWLFFGLGPKTESALMPPLESPCPTEGELLGAILDGIEEAEPGMPREQQLHIASKIFAKLTANAHASKP